MNWFKNAAGIVGAPFTGGLSLGLLDEDMRAGLPIIGPLTGAKSDEQKALEATQQRLAGEQKARMEQQRQIGLQNLANRLTAFSPMNNHLASRGLQSFSPQQMQQMAADPSGGPQASPEVQRWLSLPDEERARIRSAKNNGMAKIISGGMDWGPIPQEKIWELDRAAAAFGQQQGAEQARQAQVGAAFQGAPSVPAPIQMPTPAAARRF